MFALSRLPLAAPDCAFPIRPSLPSGWRTGPPGGGVGDVVVTPLLYCCPFQCASSNPRSYAQSCMTLWPTKRLTVEASMSLPVGLVAALTLFGLQPDVYQASVKAGW